MDNNNVEELKMDFCDWIEAKIAEDDNFGVDPSTVNLVDMDTFNKEYEDKDEENFLRVQTLYRYESSHYDNTNVGPNTRDFCQRMVRLTGLRMLTFNEITFYNNANPGFGKDGAATYSVFNWRGGPNCRHHWTKYLFDPNTRNVVKAPDQPTQVSVNGRVPYANGTLRP